MGSYRVVEGPATFPLHRFEVLEKKEHKYVLGVTQAMTLMAHTDHIDQTGEKKNKFSQRILNNMK